MTDEDPDVEYTRQRLDHIRAELRDVEAALGVPFTEETADELSASVRNG